MSIHAMPARALALAAALTATTAAAQGYPNTWPFDFDPQIAAKPDLVDRIAAYETALPRRILFVKYPYQLIAELTGGTDDAASAGADLLIDENWGWAWRAPCGGASPTRTASRTARSANAAATGVGGCARPAAKGGDLRRTGPVHGRRGLGHGHRCRYGHRC